MDTDYEAVKCKELTEKIINIFYRVYNKLGYGFLEKIYENAMMIEVKKAGIPTASQSPIKAAKSLVIENEAQLLNYLKASKIEVGLLLNFGPKPEIKRKIFDNFRK